MTDTRTPPVPAENDAALIALDAAGEMAMLRAGDGRVVFVNHAFLSAFGGKRSDWTGRWFAVAPAGPVDRGSRRFEALMRTRSGNRWIEWDERPVDSGGSISIGRDVTDKRDADAERREAEDARTRFFASVTHELRTPLAGVKGVADLLAMTSLQPDQREYVRAVSDSAMHGLQLIDEILDLSRLEAGHVDLRPEPVRPSDLARQAVELLAPRAGEKNLAIASVIRESAPEEVLADVARVRQILFNLLGNAVKFTSEGGCWVELSGDIDSENRARLIITVRDTGPGIEPSDQAKIFDHFERGSGEAQLRESGAGLGLSMVKKLVEAMDGEIGLESAPGEGASFWAALPLPIRKGVRTDRPLAGQVVMVASPSSVIRNALSAQILALGGDARTLSNPERLSSASGMTLLLDAKWSAHAQGCGARKVLILTEAAEKDRVRDNPPPGADGWLVMPVRRQSLERFIASEVPGQGSEAGWLEGEGWPLAGLRVLVAEDDPVNGLIAERTLTRLGASPERAHDGREALDRLRAGGLDAALIDLRMPEIDGPGVARTIREEGFNLPLIALTANTSETDRRACLEAGMNAFLTKPVNPETLTATLLSLSKAQKRFRVVSG
ncbi:ATP-binding protein [Hyphobacterium sp. HN65]|uniref:histidine kinase n=1 Tax=Hyphobacterium lacteum TaxID=3116575 RepID=A0ABU7LSW5_9PROT|nr:ATP-binding protein [Hyphobacterium sp. HN65]MEE2526674.1 ATP-binding protein [Hyphobacterium sp. HN65]